MKKTLLAISMILIIISVVVVEFTLLQTPKKLYLLKISAKDDNTYTDIDVSLIERFLAKMENTFWDNEFGGYYYSARYSEIEDDVKSLATISYAILDYSALYNATRNESYEKKVADLISLSEKFRDKSSYLYFGYLIRNLSRPYTPNALFEINGHGSVGSTLIFANSIIYAYTVFGNASLLSLAKNISDSVFSELWDADYGGIYSLADIGEPVKDIGDNSAFFLLNVKIYMLSNEEKFLNRALKTLDVINKMWNDGFYHAYTFELEPLNTFRYPPSKVIVTPAYVYLLAYKLTKDENYLTRSLELINRSLFDSWDAKYGGVFFKFDDSYRPLDDDKRNPLGTLHYLSLIERELNSSYENVKTLLRRRVAGLMKLLLDIYNSSYGFPDKRSREFVVTDHTILAINQFYAAFSLLMGKEVLVEDKNPPILLDIYTDNGKLIIKVIDIEGGISKVKLIQNNSSQLLAYSLSENSFIAESYSGGNAKIEVTDSSGNTAIYEKEISSSPIELPEEDHSLNLSEYSLEDLFYIITIIILIALISIIMITSRKEQTERPEYMISSTY